MRLCFKRVYRLGIPAFSSTTLFVTLSCHVIPRIRLDRFPEACRNFELTISLAKTQVIWQDIKEVSSLFIHNYKLKVVHEFVYLGSTITDNFSINSELNKRTGKAATTLSRLTKRVWSNNKLSDHTKVNVYKACVISTLLYGSES